MNRRQFYYIFMCVNSMLCLLYINVSGRKTYQKKHEKLHTQVEKTTGKIKE